MSNVLLDVNVLVSLLDSAHAHHEAAVRWFRAVALVEGWATTPITENGFVRVVSYVNYPNLRLTPFMAAASLAQFISAFAGSHRFWELDATICDPELFDLTKLTGARQITDAYLAGIAFRRGGRLATFDSSIQWRAIRGADAKLIEHIKS